jgi:hypothetical protein
MAAQKATTEAERIEVASKYEPKLYRSAEKRAELNKALTPDEEREFKELLSSVIKPILEKSGVLSLSAVNDNVVMWSHYADSHKGICLKFWLNEWSRLNIWPVCYPKERLLLKLDYESFKTEQVLQALVRTKDPSWAYEHEWRSLAPSYEEYSFPPVALVGIILGCEIVDDDEKWLKSILPAGRGIKLYRAEKREKGIRYRYSGALNLKGLSKDEDCAAALRPLGASRKRFRRAPYIRPRSTPPFDQAKTAQRRIHEA